MTIPVKGGPGKGRTLHPLLEAAAWGQLPEWARVSRERKAHVERVADLLGEWGQAWELPSREVTRWRAAGMLHDALRDEDPAQLLPLVPTTFRELPPLLIHGPAAAARLGEEGVDDQELLLALSWHSLGHPEMERLGRALYMADFLEPGRSFRREWRAGLRGKVPEQPRAVLREVVRNRVGWSMDQGHPLRPETVAFWNDLVGRQGP